MGKHRKLHGNANSLASRAPHNIPPSCRMNHVQTAEALPFWENADSSQKVAIIGIGCRFPPNANSPEDFWELVSGPRTDGPSAAQEQSVKGEDISSYIEVEEEQESAYLNSLVHLNASNSNIAYEHAEETNIQAQVILEVSLEALEDAGVSLQKIGGSNTCVFCESCPQSCIDTGDQAIGSPSTSASVPVAGLISQFFDLRGPSVTVRSSCSTGLTALNLACQSLLGHESDIAIVAAANPFTEQSAPTSAAQSHQICQNKKLPPTKDCCSSVTTNCTHSSPRSCRVGERAVTLVLKSYEAAVRDGDTVRALIRGSVSDRPGNTTATESQLKALIQSCYAKAGINPLDTDYVVSLHAGVSNDESAETRALKSTFAPDGERKNSVIFGSAGPEIGHMEAASGLLAIVKIIKGFEEELVPPGAVVGTTKQGNVKEPRRGQSWSSFQCRRASISDARCPSCISHVILESIGQSSLRRSHGSNPPPPRFVISYSAKTRRGTQRGLAELKGFVKCRLEDRGHFELADLAHTLCQHRTRSLWSVAVSAHSGPDLIKRLDARPVPVRARSVLRIGFVFSGNTSMWKGISQDMVNMYPVFSKSLIKSQGLLRDLGARWHLMDKTSKRTDAKQLELGPPIECAIQIALLELLADWGVRPEAVTSHSSGEIAAAFCAGAISHRDAMALSLFRGQVVAEATRSSSQQGTLTIGMSFEAAQVYLARVCPRRVYLASIDGPSSVTIRGHLRDIAKALSVLMSSGIPSQCLRIGGFHHAIDTHAVAKTYLAELEKHVSSSSPIGDVFYTSPVTGQQIKKGQIISARHWALGLVQPMLFYDALQSILRPPDGSRNVDALVEIGLGCSLSGSISQAIDDMNSPDLKVSYMSCLSPQEDLVSTLQSVACILHSRGAPVNLKNVNSMQGSTFGKLLHGLPPYPGDHRQRTKATQGRDEEPDTQLTADWRQILRLDDLTQSESKELATGLAYPLGGALVMPIEAMRELYSPQCTPAARFQLQNVDILEPLEISSVTDEVNLRLSIRRPRAESLPSERHLFQIRSSGVDGSCRDHCRGWISVTGPLHPTHGKNPSSLTDLGGFRSPVSVLAVGFSIALLGKHHRQPTIHPATLQEAFGLMYRSCAPLAGGAIAAMPRRVASLSVSASICDKAGHLLHGSTRVFGVGQRGFESSITLAASDSAAPLLCIEKAHFPYLESCQQPLQSVKIAWLPSLAVTSSLELRDVVSVPHYRHGFPEISDLSRATYYIIHDTLQKLKYDRIDQIQWQHQSFIRWMERMELQASCNRLWEKSSEWRDASPHTKQLLFEKVKDSSVDGELVIQVGLHLASILKGKLDPIPVIVANGLLARYYDDSVRAQRANHLAQKLVELFAIQVPGPRVLEIGAGTGTLTKSCLRALSSFSASGEAVLRYDLTDTSGHLFDMVKKKLGPLSAFVTFRTLEIETDPLWQSFEAHSYDLIIAGRFLHATHDVNVTMMHMRKLLKPEGRLIVVETTNPAPDVQLIFGTLPTWWISRYHSSRTLQSSRLTIADKESARKYGPMMSLEMWDATLRFHGFSGVDFHVHDFESPHISSTAVILSTAASLYAHNQWPLCVIVYTSSLTPLAWLDRLAAAMKDVTGYMPAIVKLDPCFQAEGKVCLFLGELEQPELQMPGKSKDATSGTVKKLINSAESLLWITQGRIRVNEDSCQSPLRSDLLHSYGRELRNRRFVALDLDPTEHTWSMTNIGMIARVFRIAFACDTSRATIDVEYAHRGSQILVPRLCRASVND